MASTALNAQGTIVQIATGTGGAKTITGATQANPCVITSTAHGLSNGDVVTIASVGGMTQLNGLSYVIEYTTANAFALRGARPVFVDIRPDTLNLDERLVAKAVTPRTKAIVPVHYAGVGCEMDVLTSIAEEYDLWTVEDNAHGLFGAYKGKPLRTFGRMAALSFHETKNSSPAAAARPTVRAAPTTKDSRHADGRE